MEQTLENKWLIKTGFDKNKVAELANKLNIHAVLAKLLFQRGIDTFEKARTFFRPSKDLLHDPFLMKDMDEAVSRVIHAIDNNEKIMILGDYDVDGTTATSLCYKFLSRLHQNLEYYIPDRYEEGYGISYQSIDYASENEVKLIITLDCGIKAVDKVDYGNEKGIDFIICDHHNPDQDLPKAVAVLDPKREDCSYPDTSLSGCGVGFKLMQAIAIKLNISEQITNESLDLLAISIAADIVPVMGENRILSRLGLEQINKNPSFGVKAIMDSAGKSKEYTVADIVFKIAPRINSAGRMSSGKKAVEILTATSLKDAEKGVQEINTLNEQRKDTDKEITDHAFQLIENDIEFESRKTTVLYDANWHKGVIGIVASRMIERYYRPTIILTGKDGVLSGSARSVRNFDLYKALEASSEFLIQYGGHKYAAGMTMKEEDLPAFKKKFDEVVTEQIEEEHLNPSIEIDSELTFKDIDRSFFQILKQFAPFGPGNMNPIFLSKGVVVNDIRKLTDKRGNDHLKCTLFDPEVDDRMFDVIGFGLGHYCDELASGSVIDLVYHIEENVWNGRTSIQLVAKDLKIN